MARHPQSNTTSILPERIPEELRLAAAMRLIPAAPHEREIVARRFLAGVKASGYDLDNLWGVVDRTNESPIVREACMAIAGPGRTAMLFVSNPAPDSEGTGDRRAHQDRAACITSASDHLDPAAVSICQALPEPYEFWAIDAFRDAGYTHVGELAYLEVKLQSERKERDETPIKWPQGVLVRPIQDDLTLGSPDRNRLKQVLEASYQNTLDCPELCGLRDTDDVIESHLSTGDFDPQRWLLAFKEQQPIGCVLVSMIPENDSAELVYIGLSPSGRGLGLAKSLLHRAIQDFSNLSAEKLVCAVDRRNTPALSLYNTFGFTEFSARDAWVRPNK
jgi:ribosomal protein S18 acetylase RimI-like enzyme